MSFTYQRSSTSLNIATKPSSSHILLDSDSDSEEESLPYLPISSEPNDTGDILKIFHLHLRVFSPLPLISVLVKTFCDVN